jgi:hypothetical protein
MSQQQRLLAASIRHCWHCPSSTRDQNATNGTEGRRESHDYKKAFICKLEPSAVFLAIFTYVAKLYKDELNN